MDGGKDIQLLLCAANYAMGAPLISGRFHFKVKKAFHTSLSFPFESEFLKKL